MAKTQVLKRNTIYNMDCVEGMRMIPDESIDLTVTSPPYDNMRLYNGFVWNFEETARELYRITKQGGVVVWVVADETKGGSETGTSFRQALFFKECGFRLHDTMIWLKTGMLPTQDRYYNTFEYMFVFSKGKPKALNFICDHKTVGGGRIQKKDTCINKGLHIEGTGTFIRNEYSRRPNAWRISTGKNAETQGHPAPFPEQLARDHIFTWSNPGDIVLDPFVGSGTTAKMAFLNDRNFIGFDISERYCHIAAQRVFEAAKRKYIGLECIRQWNDIQKEVYGEWESLSERRKEVYFSEMEKYLADDIEERVLMAWGIRQNVEFKESEAGNDG